jgi:membrane associated rhomboid family serine protease
MVSPDRPARAEPILNRQPAVVLALGGIIVLAHVFRTFAPESVQVAIVDALSLVPARYEHGVTLDNAAAIFGHVFVHAGFVHLAFNMAAFLAISGAVVRRLGAAGGGAWRYLALFFAAAAAGAGTYIALNPGSPVGAVGASGAICGLYAAYLMGARWDWRASIRDPVVLRNGFWFLMFNVALMFVVRQFGVLPIAWEAHLGGFLAGIVLFPVLAPRYALRAGPWG